MSGAGWYIILFWSTDNRGMCFQSRPIKFLNLWVQKSIMWFSSNINVSLFHTLFSSNINVSLFHTLLSSNLNVSLFHTLFSSTINVSLFHTLFSSTINVSLFHTLFSSNINVSLFHTLFSSNINVSLFHTLFSSNINVSLFHTLFVQLLNYGYGLPKLWIFCFTQSSENSNIYSVYIFNYMYHCLRQRSSQSLNFLIKMIIKI